MRHDKAAEKNFKKFYGRAPSKVRSVKFDMPKALTCLGDLLAIEYKSTKNLHKKAKMRAYHHDSDDGVKIYLHPNRKWLLISGGKFRVTDWMRG